LNTYNQKSAELINQIFSDTKNDCSCLLEPAHQSTVEFMAEETPVRDNKKDLMKALELINDSVFEKQNELTQLFRIEKLNIKSKMTFFKKADFDSIFENNKSEEARKIFWKKCPSGMLTLSPPIFNENYNIGVITVNGCFSGGSMSKYKLINGKWMLDRTISVSM
jgi:hypothetical protein